MINGIYQSATGLDSLSKMQETIAQNLANISTTGFKQQLTQVEKTAPGRLVTTTTQDMQNGPVQVTGASLDLALGSEQFLVVETPQGPAYTRNGNLGMDEHGRLMAGAWPVQGRGGDIILSGGDFTVSETGDILVQGEVVDHLALVKADRPLYPLGGGLMASTDGTPLNPLLPGEGQVMQGSLEGSNVKAAQSMVDLIAVVRLYEANQKAIESQDETLRDAVTQIGRNA